jgi:hypothetical protein
MFGKKLKAKTWFNSHVLVEKKLIIEQRLMFCKLYFFKLEIE